MINPKLVKWISASVNKFVQDRAGGYVVKYDGQEPLDNQPEKWAELYLGGPDYRFINRGVHQFDVEVLIATIVQKDYKDGFIPQEIKGHFTSVLSQGPIMVYRFGEAAASYVGCLQLRDDVTRSIDGLNYGEVSGNVRLIRATVEGYFRMTLDSPET